MFVRKEDDVVMENKLSTHGCFGSHPSILKNALPKFLTLGVGLFIASTALSAVISINASQNQDNVISVSGDLKATVVYTANGLNIEIPGVEVTLTCDEAEVSAQVPCTIDLAKEDDSSNSSGGGTTGGGDTGGGTTGGGTTGGGDTGGGATGDGEAAAYCSQDPDSLFVNKEEYDEKCNEDGTPKGEGGSGGDSDGGSGGGGFGLGNGSGNTTQDDNCGSNGFNPDCDAGGSTVGDDAAELFNSPRRIVVDRSTETNAVGQQQDAIDFGSANIHEINGAIVKVEIPKGQVVVMGFSMAPLTEIDDYCAAGKAEAAIYFGDFDDRCKKITGSEIYEPKTLEDLCSLEPGGAPGFFNWEEDCETDSNTGNGRPQAGAVMPQRMDPEELNLVFAESATQARADFHLWISQDKDGDAVAGCSVVDSSGENVWELSITQDLYDCTLEPGENYFLMAAFCNSEPADYKCEGEKAETGLRDGKTSFKPNWYRSE